MPTSSEITTEQLTREAAAFHLKKRLGQHFLVDVAVLETIVRGLDIKSGDNLVEIGPGIGFLTRLLNAAGAHVVAVELDREAIAHLETLKLKNLTIKHGDFLQFDLNRMEFFRKKETDLTLASHGAKAKIKIAGNVPYQITGLILGHLFGEIGKPAAWLPAIENIVLTIQWEVGQRLLAKPGEENYSRATLLMNYFCNVELLTKVDADSFLPPPAVRSAVLRLTPFDRCPVECLDHSLLRALIHAGFKQRRKMLKNNLGFLNVTQEEISAIFNRLNFDPQVRAERLSLQQFAILANALKTQQQQCK